MSMATAPRKHPANVYSTRYGAFSHMSTRSTRAARLRDRRASPLGREGLVILALRKLHHQPYCGASIPARDRWQAAHGMCHPLSCSLTSAQMRHTRWARARFVSQSLHTLRQKPPHPCVDKAAADPNRGGNVRDRHALGDEEKKPAPAGTPRRNGRGALPRQERLTLGRREADRARGGAPTRHIDPSPAGDYASVGDVQERANTVENAKDTITIFEKRNIAW